MLPSERRLLQGIHDALQGLAREAGAGSQPVLAAVNVALNELILRNDRELFVALYAEGRRLAGDGLALARSKTGAPSPGEVEALLPAVDPSLHFDLIGARIDTLGAALAELVRVLTPFERRDRQVGDYLARIVDWEQKLNAWRIAKPEEAVPAESSSGCFTAEEIAQYLRHRFPARGEPRISGLRRLSGGFSKLTVLFDVDWADGSRQCLVIRAEQPAHLLFLEGARVVNEYHVLKLAHAAGLAVAEPLWLEDDPSRLGARFLVTTRAAGRNIGTAVSVDEKIPQTLLEDMVRHLVSIHRTRVDRDDSCVQQSHLARWRQFRTLTECTAHQVAFWRENVERLELPPSATRVRIFEWLAANVPECEEAPGFVHADYGLHNILVGDDDRVACILDWEGAALGDPAEDFVWFADGLHGHAERGQLLDLYLKAGGRALSEERLRYFDVFRSLKYAVVCPTALTLFERHRSASVAACQLGLLFPYYGSLELNRHIRSAVASSTVPSK